MIATTKGPSGLPIAAAAAQIARLLEDLADSIASVGLEASEEARYASRLKM